jgi:DUF1009 family protein
MSLRIGIIAGGGGLPANVVAAAREKGQLGTILALEDFVSPDIFPDAKRVTLGQFGQMTKLLRKANCTHVCFAGIVKRPDFKRLRLDFKAVRHLPGTIRAAGQGDDALMRHVLGLFEQEGFEVIPPQDVCAEIMLGEGVIGDVAMTEEHRADALKACKTASAIGALDIGQGAVVARGVVLAVEAQEGTDAMLDRVADLPEALRGVYGARVGVLAKLVKPTQDTRVDLPTLGPETVRRAAAAGLAGIVAEAGGAFILDREETIAAANAAGLFIAGLPKSG